jgi:phospholipid/cholesterol/gamma-HCH transport system substrate-binding protein
MRNRNLLLLIAILCAVAMSGCASLSVDALPVPGTTYRDGYDIVLEFTNALNLPDRAKVLMDGTAVGAVQKVAVTSDGVQVTARIAGGVTVPSNIHAVLQQGTVLGDTYVALERTDQPSAAPLKPNGRIPVAQTTSPPQLEDTLAALANFIGSGSIQRAQRSVIGINRITPPRPEIRAMASRVATDLSDLSANVDTVDLWLRGVDGTATVFAQRAPTLGHWLSPQGVADFRHTMYPARYMAVILPSLGTIYYNGYWLVPVIESAADALETIQHSKWAFDEEIPRWYNLVTNFYDPERKYPAINITSVVDSDGRDLTGNMQQVLRMIGAMP